MEKRILIALVLSTVAFAVWTLLFPPPTPPAQESVPPAVIEPTPSATALPAEAVAAGSAPVPEVQGAVAGEREERVRLTSEDLDVELTSQGAAVASLVLRHYTDDDGKPLELVQTLEHQQAALPLQLVTEKGIDRRPYQLEKDGDGYRFRWADGKGSWASKRISLAAHGYGLDVSVQTGGELGGSSLCVGTGMRNLGANEKANRFSSWGDVAVGLADSIERLQRLKVKEAKVFPGGGVRFAGFVDTYFLNVYLPEEPVREVRIAPVEITPAGDGGKEKEGARILQVQIAGVKGDFRGQLLTAPKEYELLKRLGHGLDKTLDFGFFHPISVFFLKALRWIHGQVGNYGLAIILLTLAIRVVLFPLMHTSTVSMRKMQRLQPKVKAIQEKYRKNKSDPQVRTKMNQEMMELYKLEGVNPMGGCLPMLVQLPILFALYTLFAYAIELRHAPFWLWIQDLSAKDPYYVTPVLMTATMWLQQRLAPQAGDPQQQRIMRLMPLVFGIMFLGFPSGLVLYWLANNVITILQQEVTLRLIGERGAAGGGRSGRERAAGRKGR